MRTPKSVDGYDFEDYGIKITIKKTDTVLGEEKGKKKERKEDNCESKSEVSPPDASRLNERSALSQELIHYVYTGGDCQGLNRVKKEMYLKTDVDSFLEAARKELKEKLCISSRKETPFNARLCGIKNAKRCEKNFENREDYSGRQQPTNETTYSLPVKMLKPLEFKEYKKQEEAMITEKQAKL